MHTLSARGNDELVNLSGDKVTHPTAPVVSKSTVAARANGPGASVFTATERPVQRPHPVNPGFAVRSTCPAQAPRQTTQEE